MSLDQQLAQEAAKPKSTEPKLKDGDFRHIELDLLDDNPHQPRLKMDATVLKELAESIRSKGVLQPILAKPTTEGRYIIVAGHRRVAALRQLRESTTGEEQKRFLRAPATLRLALSDTELASMAYVENAKREGLTIMEEARSLDRMVELGMATTNEELAALTDQELARVKRLRRIGRAPKWLKEALDSGVLVVTGEAADGTETRERRSIDLMSGLQVLMLFEHFQKTSPKKAEERASNFMKKALAQNWSFRRVEAAAKASIEGRAVENEDGADQAPSASRPVFSQTSKRFTIDSARLRSATAAQLAELQEAITTLIAEAAAKAQEGQGQR